MLRGIFLFICEYAPVSSACARELEKFWKSVRNVRDLVLGPYGDKKVNEAAMPPILSSTWSSSRSQCSSLEFECTGGGCVGLSSVCDGKVHCLDGSDETACDGISEIALEDPLVLNRARRQATECRRKDQWRCRDGTCIGIDGKCDGIVDCPDRSDESHALCRKNQCQSNWFRCTYGACVDGTAPCNNITECADNSDELLPRCRNENNEVNGTFKCQNGQTIQAAYHCDGAKDCQDGSDETVRSCAGKTCYSYLFQCAYGACVDQGADCNGITECADGSDESDELCNRSGSGTDTGTTTGSPPVQPIDPNQPVPSGKCQLPPYPANGRYEVQNAPNASPSQIADFWVLQVFCNPGFGILDRESKYYCTGGVWEPDSKLPDCVRYCRLNRHPSVEYHCRSDTSTNRRPCNNYEPPGTVAIPECVRPNYYSASVLSSIFCSVEGMWSDSPTCSLGLTKNGTNITIIVKDKVQIHISNFQYAVPGTTENDVDYDIDETDWRSGGASRNPYWSIKLSDSKEPRPVWSTTGKPGKSSNSRNKPNRQSGGSGNTRVNFVINNSTVVVNSDDARIHFRN